MGSLSLLKYLIYYNPIIMLMPDKLFLRLHFLKSIGAPLNLKNPRTFNEKLQWIKLYDRKPIYSIMVDKYEAKKYVSDRIGMEHVVPTIGVWNNFNEIPFDELPDQFVLKCTHDSGGLVICTDKKKFDADKSRKKISHSLKRNYFWMGREWPYKNVPHRILAEEYLTDVNQSGSSLNVYKVMTFNGEPKIIQTIQNDKLSSESIDYFDIEWNKLDIRQDYPNSVVTLPKPKHLDEMLSFASILSEGRSFLRVDFYEVNDMVYFSEFTFFSDNGFARFNDSEWDRLLGDWISL